MNRGESKLVLVYFLLAILMPAILVWLPDYINNRVTLNHIKYELFFYLYGTFSVFLPFFSLSMAAYRKRFFGVSYAHVHGLVGAGVASFFIVVFVRLLPYMPLVSTYGAGANFGIGVLMLFLPIYIFPVMYFGYVIGKRLHARGWRRLG